MDKDDFSFITVLKNADIDFLTERFKLPRVDIQIEIKKMSIRWWLHFWLTDYGITKISPMIQSVVCEIAWKVCGVEDLTAEEILILMERNGVLNSDVITGSITINSNTVFEGKGWQIDKSEYHMRPDGQIYPENCDIDFREMTIKVY